jgi:glycosyltransferase involved in cell wall biosynthesis
VGVAYVTERALQERYATHTWSTSYSSIDLGTEAFVTDDIVARRFASERHRMKGTAEEPWRLAFVGSLAQPYKGADVLIDALALARRRGLEVTLTMAGDGRQRQALERQARRRQVDAHVHFTGAIPAGAGVRTLLDSSDVFILPSRTEGLPRAMIEAMARGIPCLGSAVGGIPELLPSERLVRPDDAPGLSDAIVRLCADRENLLSCALRDLARAGAYHAQQLQPRRRQFYGRQRAAPARTAHRTAVCDPGIDRGDAHGHGNADHRTIATT